MGGGSSKQASPQDIEVGPRSGGGKKPSTSSRMVAGQGQIANSPAKAGQKRSTQFEVSMLHLQSHEINEVRTITNNQRIITDILVGSNRSAAGQYQSVIDSLKIGKYSFEDPNFPAQLSSLTKDVKSFPIANQLTWKRPAQFFGSNQNLSVFGKLIEPQDVIQGDLGDSYLLSALACLAEKPGWIERLFQAKEVSPLGLYCVWICYDGEWQQVIIDDYFPCTQQGPAFSRSYEGELWALIIEKAYAKLYGSYDKIEGGLAGHAVHDLTGAPYHYFVRDNSLDFDENDIWDFVVENVVKKGYIVTASSESNTRDIGQKNDVTGIASNHSYSILDARDVVDSQGQRDRIIQVRNPWGHFEWTGDWSDNSHRWTQSLAIELGLQRADDGIFWMSVNDFLRTFSQLMVTKVEDNFKYSSLRSTKAQVSEKVTVRVFTMKVFQRMQRCHIGVTQRDKRNFSKNPKTKAYEYSLMRVMVSSLDDHSAKSPGSVNTFVGGHMECERDVSIEIEKPLEAGVYLVYIEADWAQDEVRDFVVWCYGEQPVEFLEVKTFVSGGKNVTKTAMEYEALIDDMLEAHQETEDPERIHRYNDKIYRTSGSTTGYIYFLYENVSLDVHLREEIAMKQANFLEICAPKSFSDQVKVRVAPGDRQIVKYRVGQLGRGQYSYQTQVNFILLQQVDPHDEEKLMQLALLQPSKVKQREMHGYLMKVFVHTFVYYGGICFLYVNKTSQKTYVEDLELDKLQNLRSDIHDLNQPIHIEVPPQSQRLLNLTTIDSEAEIAYQPRMTFFLK